MTTCGVCGADTVPEVERPATSYAPVGQYSVARCVSCGCGVTSPRPSSEDLRAQYETTYNYDAHSLIAPEKRWRADRILAYAHQAGQRSILDVGTMYGFLLDAAKRRGFSECVGVEPSQGPAASARARGLDVHTGLVEDLLSMPEKRQFDLIVVQHVLEHVPDPAAFVTVLRSLLRKGGRLCICVPNFDSKLRHAFKEAWGWYQVPVHIHHFGKESLHRLLGAADFRVVDTRTRGGDSLFVMMTLLNALGREVTSAEARPGALTTAAVRAASVLLRPHYFVGDDELMVLAE